MDPPEIYRNALRIPSPESGNRINIAGCLIQGRRASGPQREQRKRGRVLPDRGRGRPQDRGDRLSRYGGRVPACRDGEFAASAELRRRVAEE